MATKRCFVIMSFKPEFDHVYEAAIKKALVDLNIECIRVDDDSVPKNIPHRIIREIIESDLIVADVSEPSPNVFYELGISHALGNKTIIISRDRANIPFDVLSEYATGYKDDRDGLRLLYYELTKAVKTLIARPNEPSNIVQLAGRDFFDLQAKIRSNLRRIVEEGDRMAAFRTFLDHERRTDNANVIERLCSQIVDAHNDSTRTTFVALSGGAGLGKTTLAKALRELLRSFNPKMAVSILSTDAFMLDRAERESRDLSGYDPRASRMDALFGAIEALRNGERVSYREYDHRTGEHEGDTIVIEPANIVVVDGVHSFHPSLLRTMKLKLFLYASPTDAKELRFLADLFERNYTVHAAFQHAEDEYESFEKYVLHYAKFADQVVQIDSYWKYSLVTGDEGRPDTSRVSFERTRQ